MESLIAVFDCSNDSMTRLSGKVDRFFSGIGKTPAPFIRRAILHIGNEADPGWVPIQAG